MVRILIFLLLIFAAGLGFAWLADRPGEIVMNFGGYEYKTSLLVAATAAVVLIAAVLILWWIVAGVWNSPRTISRYFRARKRDRGYQSLSTGLIAAGAGDTATARKMMRQVRANLSADQEPLIHLLEAQALMLEGDRDAARRKFEAMAEDPETRLLGLRGLYLEAERVGDHEAARQFAEKASRFAPQAEWAAAPTLAAQIARGEHDAALALLDAQRSSGQIDRAKADREKAVILAAKAMELQAADPAAANAAAAEANRLAPGLVPAAVMAAKAHFAANDLKRGARIIEAAWKIAPHPDLADAYVHARPGDSVSDRLKRAEKLASLAPNDAESHLVVARAALQANDFAKARREAEQALETSPRKAACLLMADIAETESGDQGRVRYWLARALRAPADPAWVADGRVSERWAPFSPITGRLDAFEWKAPVERLSSGAIEPEPEAEVAAPDAIEMQPAASEPARKDAASEPAVAETAPAPAAAETVRLPDDPGAPSRKTESKRFRLF
jgi:HemY protein